MQILVLAANKIFSCKKKKEKKEEKKIKEEETIVKLHMTKLKRF